jgi:chromosome partitioning protein
LAYPDPQRVRAADYLLVPLQCEYYALEGISMITRLLEPAPHAGVNSRLELLGVIMTMFDGRTRLSQQVVTGSAPAFRRIGL